jgi:hypothetical protein
MQRMAVQIGAPRQVGHAGERRRRARLDPRAASAPIPFSMFRPSRTAGWPRLPAGSSSDVSQPLMATSISRTTTPCRLASCTSCDGL